MQNIKIIFFDVDGTLIDIHTKTMSPKTEEALLKLQANGIKLCIATGRPLSKVPRFDNIQFDAYLTFNGSYCSTETDIIYHQPIPKTDVLKIVENAQAINRPVSVATIHKSGANGRDQALIDYYAISEQTVDIAEDFDAMIQEDIYQIMLGLDPHQYDDLLKDVEGAQITAWWDCAVDVIPKGGSKAVGVREILNYFNLTTQESMAFGDGTNDVEMLQAVGVGVAMGNATDNVKAIADDVCEPVDQEGIYQYCMNHNLI
ncbi:HAD family hydrolase [Erysipelothrix larvae]|uniref:HAD family hydrolase n=1 Tax=Erysipelothrix larvae TaxID=1514105 RepID=A0A109UHB5_9FIRM|nr:Cof-type HAD-IIB family hydrolase [Erysipelothrix larvae]AMC93853.1 HAD family hydrolase [Erysipelothrix larvae]